MEKRLPLALFLSVLVLVGYNYFFGPAPKQKPSEVDVPSEIVTEGVTTTEGVLPDTALAPAVGEVVSASEEQRLTLNFGQAGEVGRARAVFTNRGARLAELRLGGHYIEAGLSKEAKGDWANWLPFLTEAPLEAEGLRRTGSLALVAVEDSASLFLRGPNLDAALWTMEPLREGGRDVGVHFEYAPGTGVRFEKTLRQVPGTFEFEVELAIENESHESVGKHAFWFTPAEVVPPEIEDRFYPEPRAIAAWREDGEVQIKDEQVSGGKRLKESTDSLGGTAPYEYVGVENKYFAALLRPASVQDELCIQAVRYRQLPDFVYRRENPTDDGFFRFLVADAYLRLEVPPVGAKASSNFRLYVGPKNAKPLLQANEAHQSLIDKDLGFFDGIARLLLKVLGFFQGITGNWGVAIILLTILVRAMLFPINRRSQTAMARYQTKMKRVQPKLDEVKKRYEKDPQKLRQEQAKLMQEEGAFPPLGGCLPMFLQFPVFIGLYRALGVSADLRQAPFVGWINDLSRPDALIDLGWNLNLPLMGKITSFNLLPILMVISMIINMRSMPKPTEAQAARMQKMMVWMPLIFGLFLYNYAAGLALYILTSSIIGILEIRVIKKLWPIDDAEQPKKQGGWLAKIAEAQKEQMTRVQTEQQRGKGKRRPGR